MMLWCTSKISFFHSIDIVDAKALGLFKMKFDFLYIFVFVSLVAIMLTWTSVYLILIFVIQKLKILSVSQEFDTRPIANDFDDLNIHTRSSLRLY